MWDVGLELHSFINIVSLLRQTLVNLRKILLSLVRNRVRNIQPVVFTSFGGVQVLIKGVKKFFYRWTKEAVIILKQENKTPQTLDRSDFTMALFTCHQLNILAFIGSLQEYSHMSGGHTVAWWKRQGASGRYPGKAHMGLVKQHTHTHVQ